MRIRRVITAPRLLSYFNFEAKYYDFENNLHYNTQIYNNFTFFSIFTAACFLMGFFKPIFWSIGLSNFFLVLFLFLKTKKLSHGVAVLRKAPKFARERNQVEVTYIIANETGFPLNGLHFIQEFDGLQVGHFSVDYDQMIPPQTKLEFIKKIKLDAGMGVKVFRPVDVIIRDELGIFDFKVTFQDETEIEVYPLIEETPLLKNSISPDAIDYGFYEIAKRGDSNLFIGTREYRHGDPIKHINWKLSKKTNKIVVNEYEKNTNTFITLLLDLNLDNQLGIGELSTWEAAKDLALSIAVNEIRLSNLIQVISNNLFIPFSSGKNQLSAIEKHFTFHELVSSKESHHLRHLENLPARGQIYYFCPMVTTPRVTETLELLLKLKMTGQSVMVLMLDPYQELLKSVKGEMRSGLMEMERHAKEEFLRLEKKFRNVGIPMITIKVQKDINLHQQLLNNASEFLEVS